MKMTTVVYKIKFLDGSYGVSAKSMPYYEAIKDDKYQILKPSVQEKARAKSTWTGAY